MKIDRLPFEFEELGQYRTKERAQRALRSSCYPNRRHQIVPAVAFRVSSDGCVKEYRCYAIQIKEGDNV
jgi:hypothetical protein